jgi:hypothetical protein
LKAIEESAEDLIDQKKIKGSQKETLRSFIVQIKQLSRKIVCEKNPDVNAAYEATIAAIKADIEANWKIKPGKEGNKPKVETSSAYVQRVYAYLLNEQERPAWEVFLKVITEKDTHSSPFFNKLCASTKVKAFKERIRSELGQIPVDAGAEKICEQLEAYRKQFDVKSSPSQASVEMKLPRGVRGGR